MSEFKVTVTKTEISTVIIKAEDVDAKLEHGVLTINIPKENKKVEQTKRILIK